MDSEKSLANRQAFFNHPVMKQVSSKTPIYAFCVDTSPWFLPK